MIESTTVLDSMISQIYNRLVNSRGSFVTIGAQMKEDKTKVVYVGQEVVDNDRRNRGTRLRVVDFSNDVVVVVPTDELHGVRRVSMKTFLSSKFTRNPR